MKKIIIYTLLLTLVSGGGVALGFYIRNQTLNPKATIPTFFSRVLTFFVKKGEEVEDDLLYHDTNITDFITKGSTKTKVAVEGTVLSITLEPDGDYHMVVTNSVGLPLVTEFIPEIPSLPTPAIGDKVKIWGIVRFDEPHNWWELHPVIGWKKI
ncbi:hypothetical protein H0W91_04125 [Patescibacteria group bacterium]|nr:hypothetical protein [Patescibacteria group bacterium]